MIARLRGKPVSRAGERLVLDVGGVGYLVHATPTRAAARRGGGEVTLETYLHVREDALQLYGFARAPPSASCSSTCSRSRASGRRSRSRSSPARRRRDLRRAIALEDTARFEAIPGIGKKTAQRVVLELKEKLGSVDEPTPSPASRHVVARDALVELGYSLVEAEERARRKSTRRCPPRSACARP